MRHFDRFASVGLMLTVVLIAATARADIPAFTMSGFTDNTSATNTTDYSLGYTFELQQPETVTALGALDIGGNSIGSNVIPVKIYWSSPTPMPINTIYPPTVGHGPGGTAVGFLEGSGTVSSADPILSLSGDTYTSGDGFRYHTLDTPIQLGAGFYMIAESDFGTGFQGAATDFAAAPTIFGPTMTDSSNSTTYYATFDNAPPDNTAGYNNALAPSAFGPGIFGPNFLIAVPEPGMLALLTAWGAILLRRRRQPAFTPSRPASGRSQFSRERPCKICTCCAPASLC